MSIQIKQLNSIKIMEKYILVKGTIVSKSLPQEVDIKVLKNEIDSLDSDIKRTQDQIAVFQNQISELEVKKSEKEKQLSDILTDVPSLK